ncbi:hypothetical protein KM043_001606 [Ampulex compressa]|nr:hypothetical protein KM043_001606 [Ampulex compressa]
MPRGRCIVPRLTSGPVPGSGAPVALGPEEPGRRTSRLEKDVAPRFSFLRRRPRCPTSDPRSPEELRSTKLDWRGFAPLRVRLLPIRESRVEEPEEDRAARDEASDERSGASGK